MLSKGEQKLLAWYAVITMTSLLVNAFTQGPMPNCYDYTDDPHLISVGNDTASASAKEAGIVRAAKNFLGRNIMGEKVEQ